MSALHVVGAFVYVTGAVGLGVWAARRKEDPIVSLMIVGWPAFLAMFAVFALVLSPYFLGCLLVGGKKACAEAWEELGKGGVL